MKKERIFAAKRLLEEEQDPGELEDVLDYFESPIAEKVAAGDVEEKRIYETFYHWIRLYWQASQKYIKDRQKQEPEVWTDVEKLYKRLSVFAERDREKELGRKIDDQELILSPEELQEELRKEAKIKTAWAVPVPLPTES